MSINIENLSKHYEKKNVEEKALVEAQNAQKREENRLNEVVSQVEAARRAGESIKKASKTKNDI